MAINERLKQILFELDKNAKELANELKVTPTTISKTLKGDTLPSSKLLIPLGEKLGISIDWLLFGKRDMFIDGHAQDYHTPINDPNSNKSKSKCINQIDKERIRHLEQQIKLLTLSIEDKNKRIEDKEELIKLLKNSKNN
ncbi:helix-turn-helix domain-containing protein [Aureispira anguillae]|uniref:Helix-turn-helix domain-containing protein n=1 Tax=Aureispira anguillae TaxID=2864201 RepID=A0A915YHF7_9BACT|nr:helix-turn-helix domain-containing protein [Aureispira anguillae]BDS13023.1 helix-turn-helix domain-containing protein [Aureispira anguillae]BDS13087.1 helix-turn-helix domain-containing protein [Aureispira anguillae]